jgi:chromosome segregation ATPase
VENIGSRQGTTGSVEIEDKAMIDDARLKAMRLVNDAKQTADQALSTVDSTAGRKRLHELHETLEEIEQDLTITELDHTLSELRSFQHRLRELDASIDREVPELKPIARKVEHAAKEIGIVVDAEAKVIPPV